MKKKMMVLLGSLALAACATVPSGPRAYPPQTVIFDPAEVAWAEAEGNNTISGNAVMRTVGGDVRTCAGSQAGVIPVSAYASERMQMMFKSADRGYVPANEILEFEPAPDAFKATVRNATCDSQGNFVVSGLPDGEYFVVANVTWGVPQGNAYYSWTSTEGGAVMQRVRLSGGETERVVLTN